MKTICNPAKQKKFPNPNNILQKITIKNPKTPKKHYIYKFNKQHKLLTTTAATKLKKNINVTKYFTKYETKNPILQIFPPKNKTQTKKTQKKTQKKLLQQLKLLRDHQHYLTEQINRLAKKQKLFPII